VYKTIIGFDIENFTEDCDALTLKKKRSDLKLVIEEALENTQSNIFGFHDAIDTGDGFFSVSDSRNYSNIFAFFNQLSIVAKKLNSLRFRGIIHSGDCSSVNAVDNTEQHKNLVGAGINEVARYLDCSPLKELLKKETAECFVYGISPRIYSEVSEQSFFEKESFSEYPIIVKKFNSSIFLFTKNKILNNCMAVENNNTFEMARDFEDFLKTNDITLNKDCDLFVYPEVSRDYPNKLDKEILDSFKFFESYCKNPNNVIISGAEQIGKTSLCKNIFKQLYDTKKFIPLFISTKEK
jgi:hypothetical protein